MAKKQNFIVGSTNPNTNTWTTAELNNGWDKYQVLKSGDLDGVFKAVSDYSNDSSQEIWNAIRILKGSNPTGASTSELGNIISTLLAAKASKTTDFITPLTSNNKGATKADLNTLREEIETSSLTFKGYVATSAPSASTYGLIEGNIWINASAMPTTFPVAASSIRVWNGTSWAATTDAYTVKDFDFFRNINDGEGYYWFGGQWVVMSTDMSTTYFTLNQTSGKWEIKSSVNLPGNPTTTTPAAGTNSTRIATTAFVANNFAKLASPALTGTPTAPTPTSGSTDNQIATKKYVDEAIAPLPSTTYFPDVFDVKWSDYILSNPRWLRADDFAWHNRAKGPIAYQHLVDEVKDFSTATLNANLGSHNWRALAWDGTKFVALGDSGYISTSTDGVNWTAATQNANLGSRGWRALAWNGTRFVALGDSGYMSISTDGINWMYATQNTDLGSRGWCALAWNGTKFVALSFYGYISTSTDGINWTSATQNTDLGENTWDALAWDGTKFVALGNSGYISTSNDGLDWTSATQNANLGSHNWRALAWDGTKFVALGDSGYISTSNDGLDWTSATQNANLGSHNWRALAWDGTKFVALGNSGYISTGILNIKTETIAGITVTYYQAEDGHKLVLPDQESNVTAIYNATGVAWYYIIDTTNQRFKLPRRSAEFLAKADYIDYAHPIEMTNGGTSSVYGWFYISGHSYNGQETVSLNGQVVYWGGNNGNERLSGDCILWVKPGDVISWATWNGQVAMSRIYPAVKSGISAPNEKYLYFYNGSNT